MLKPKSCYFIVISNIFKRAMQSSEDIFSHLDLNRETILILTDQRCYGNRVRVGIQDFSL